MLGEGGKEKRGRGGKGRKKGLKCVRGGRYAHKDTVEGARKRKNNGEA